MGSLTRRAWFGRIGGVVLGATLARELPGLAPRPLGLTFHKDAFVFTMAPLSDADVERFAEQWVRATGFPHASEIADRIRRGAAADLVFVKGDAWPS